MKNKVNLLVLGIALFIYIFELKIFSQLNITSNQYFLVNMYYNSYGKEIMVVDLTFILLVILLLLSIVPKKLISKLNGSIINLVLWISALGVFISETSLRPEFVNGSIKVRTFVITYQQSNAYTTSLNALAYFLILILIINIYLTIRTKDRFTGINLVFIVLCWLVYTNELSKFPLSYTGTIKSNLFRTLFVKGDITIIHYTIFLILLPILFNIFILVNKYLKKSAKKQKTKQPNINLPEENEH